MSNSLGPVDIEFALKNINFKEETERMKEGIRGITVTARQESAKMTSALGDFASQSAKQMKESIDIQKQAIKDLQQKIKELTDASKGTGGDYRQNLATQGALSNAKRDLLAEQNSLNEMQKAQVLRNKEEAESQSPIVAGLGKWVIGLMSVAAAMKIGKSVIESTNTTAVKFEQAIAGATAGTQYFFKSLASGDWSNFLENLEKAVSNAREYVLQMERIQNLKNEEGIKSSGIEKQIAELRDATYDKSDKNNDKRKAALEEIIILEKKQFDAKADIAKKEYEFSLQNAAIQSGIDKGKIENYIKEFSSLDKMIEKGEEYNKITKAMHIADLPSNTLLQLKDERDALGPMAAEAGLFATQIGKVTQETKNQLAAYLTAQQIAESAYGQKNRRDKMQLAEVDNNIETQKATATKKAQDAANKAAKAQLDYDTEIGRQRISNQIDIEQTTLNLQKDGAEKQRQQAELDFRKTLVDLANQKADQLKKMNMATGGIDEKTGQKTVKYVSTLPDADQKQLDDKVILAEKIKNNTVDKINEKEAEKIKQIWQEVTDYRLKDMDKELAAVKQKYDQMALLVKKANNPESSDLLAGIELKREAAKAEIKRKYALQELDFEEKIDSQKNELSVKGFNRQSKLDKANFDTWLKYENKKLEILKKSDDPTDKKNAALLEGEIKIKTHEQEIKVLKEKLDTIAEITDYADQLISKYKEQLGLTEDQAKVLETASGLAKGVAQIASGNLIGGSMQILSSTLDLFVQAPVKFSENWDNVQKQIEKVIASLNIAEKSLANIGNVSSVTSLQVIKSELLDLADSAKTLNVELSKSSTGKRRTTNMNLPGTDMVKQAADLNAEIEKLSNRLLQGDISDEQRKAIEAVLNSYNDLLSQIDTTIQNLTGTTVSDLGNALADAFMSGEDAAQAWGAKVDDIIKNIIERQLTAQLLTKPITDAVNTLVNDSSDGLSTEEAVKFKNTIDQLYSSTAPAFEAMRKALESAGFNFSASTTGTTSGLTGSVRGATEETMGAMLGQFMAIRVDIKSVLANQAYGQDDVSKQLFYMKQIADNTSHNVRLIKIEEGINEMNTTLKAKL